MTVIATWAFAGTYDKELNLKNHLAGLEQAAAAGAEVIVYPEVSLQGYPVISGRAQQREVLEEVYETAETLDGPSVRAIAEAAADLQVHVVFGMTERTSTPAVLYNTMLLIGPGGPLAAYRKVHVGIGEQVIWARGSQWPVTSTPFGKVGMLICYDKAWPESCRELTLGGAEILIMSTAWSMRADDTDPATSLSVEQYLLYERARAAENARWFVSSNFTGELGGLRFFGHSQIVDPTGRVVATTGVAPEASFAMAEIDVVGGIQAAAALGGGARLWRDRRPETYAHLATTLPQP